MFHGHCKSLYKTAFWPRAKNTLDDDWSKIAVIIYENMIGKQNERSTPCTHERLEKETGE